MEGKRSKRNMDTQITFNMKRKHVDRDDFMFD